jgi:hypothetical protein
MKEKLRADDFLDVEHHTLSDSYCKTLGWLLGLTYIMENMVRLRLEKGLFHDSIVILFFRPSRIATGVDLREIWTMLLF